MKNNVADVKVRKNVTGDNGNKQEVSISKANN